MVAPALLVAACTGGDSGPTPPTPAARSDGARATMAAVLGGTQAVQDFIVHLDMSVLAGDELIPILDQVKDRARSGAGEPRDLAGGFTMRTVDSLRAEMVDPAGQALPSLTVDFALLESTPEHAAATRELLALAIGDEDDGALLATLLDEPSSGDTLVEIVSASYEDRYTHAGPGDSSVLDLSFVAAPADETLVSVHLFGQTIPGDPAVEAGLSPLDLFAFRWNQGLVRMLGDETGIRVIASDATIEAAASPKSASPKSAVARPLSAVIEVTPPGVETLLLPRRFEAVAIAVEASGSVLRRQEVKAFTEATLMTNAFTAATTRAEQILTDARDIGGSGSKTIFVHGVIASSSGGGLQAVQAHCVVASVGEGGSQFAVGTRVTVPGDPPRDECDTIRTTPSAYKTWWALSAIEGLCVSLATEMRRANDARVEAESIAAELAWTSTTFVGPTPPFVGPNAPVSPDPLAAPARPLGCGAPTPPRSEQPGAGIVGDVHVFTFDGVRYGNQASGEFLAFDNDVAVVQARTEPWGGDSPHASVMTAVAVAVGGSSVSMHRGGVTWIDGEEARLERGVPRQVDDGSLLWAATGWVVVWPDGTELHVEDLEESASLSLVVHPSEAPMVGLLGTPNGDPADDLLTRSGERFPHEAVSTDLEGLYGTFLDSWRITPDESLFHYGPGEDAEGFQLDGFPRLRLMPEELDQRARETAEAACRAGGITREELLASCVFDVVVTGDIGFVYAHYVMQAALPEPPPAAGPSPAPASGTNSFTVGDLTVEFEAFEVPGWCTWTDDGPDRSLGAEGAFSDSQGREVGLQIQFADVGTPVLRLIVLLDRRPHAWVTTFVDPPSGVIDAASFEGGGLSLSGSAFVNDPFDPALSPSLPLPPGARLVPFTLQVRCGP